MTKQRVALIDGDIVLFESACKGEQRFDWGDGNEPSVHVDLDSAIRNLNKRLKTIQLACEADRILIALSCSSRNYWRHDLWEPYKAQRSNAYRPELLKQLRGYATDEFDCVWRERLEADDVLGIWATMDDICEYVIVTSDKDLRQIPGLHLNHMKLSAGIQAVNKEQGFMWHMMQTLMGDSTDNYPGCPGVGPKKAKKILDDPPFANPCETWHAVVSAFVRKGKTPDDALIQARVAKILQAEDWVDGKVKLWDPPSLS